MKLTWSRSIRLGVNLLAALTLTLGALALRPVTSVSAARTFYVSRSGNNGDGMSWTTAWNELSRINWNAVAAGDTIVVDGGAVACPALGPGYNCGMVYNSTLSVTKSGANGAPITIRLASEPGRNGTAIIDGGITAWSRCGDYASEPTPPSTPNGAGVRDTGITLNNAQWIVIDGTKWGGIEVRNHTRYGLSFSSSQRVTARYLKIHHNTDPSDTTNNAVGVTQGWASAYNTLARSEIFRNGQDAVRGAGDYFTLEENYIHDHYCNHPDGVQSFVPTSNSDVPDNEGEVRGLVIRRNVFDKIGMQTIFLGENATHNSWNVDVTIHDNLFLNNDYVIKSKHASSRNWNIYNNTIVNARNFAVEWCCATPGARAPMTINNNIIFNVKPGNTAFYLPTGGGNTTFTSNCLYSTGARSGNVSESGTVTGDPLFINSSLGNFALASSSACVGKGSAMTSVSQLINSTGGGAAQPTQPPPPTATRPPTLVPPTPTRTTTAVPPTATIVVPTATTVAPTSVPPQSGGATLTLRPVADAYVDAAQRTANHGGSTIVRTVSSPEQRTYMRFEVRGLGGLPVTRAQLRVYANGSSNSGFQVQRVNNNAWGEMNLTFNNKPELNGVVANSGGHSGGAWVTVDITNLINGEGTFSLALVSGNTKAVSYPSDEANSNRPVLVVETGASSGATVPEPTSVPPTATRVPPTATSVPPTPTSVPPTATSLPASATPQPPASPATLTLAPMADAYVDEGSSRRNHGLSEIVRTNGSPEQLTYLRFTVQGVAGRPVTRVVLRIYANGSSSAGFEVRGVPNNDWSETEINYRNRPSTSGAIAESGSHNHASWVTVDLTGHITGDGTYTIALLTDGEKPVSYPSREAPANRPELVLTLGG